MSKIKADTVKQYFALMEQFRTLETDYEHILHPDIEQTEYPNWLTVNLTISDRELLFQRMPQGKKLLQTQTYGIQRCYETADAVIAEVIWTAVIAIEAGPFKPGQELKAYFCCVFDFKDGLIYRQRNYDCFERF